MYLFPDSQRNNQNSPHRTGNNYPGRRQQKSHKSPVSCWIYSFPSQGCSYLGSPAVAWVQYCCVVLQRPLVQADIFCFVVAKLQEQEKHHPSELIWWSCYCPTTIPPRHGPSHSMGRSSDTPCGPRHVCKAIPLAEPFSGCRGHQSWVCDPHPRGSPSPAWKRISGNIWTKKRWSVIGFPKWASAPTLVLITLGITGQLLRSLLTQRHGKQSSKSKQRPFHHAELQQYLFVYSKNIYWMKTPGQAPSVSEHTFRGTDKSPLIWPSRCTVFYVDVHPAHHPAISTSGKTAMLAFSMYMVRSRLCSPWKPN